MLVRKMKRTRARSVPGTDPSVPVPKPSTASPTSPTWKPHFWRILAAGALALVAYSNAAVRDPQDPRVDPSPRRQEFRTAE